MRPFHHLHVFGAFVDQHGAAIETIGAALALVAVGFFLCPYVLRVGGQR